MVDDDYDLEEHNITFLANETIVELSITINDDNITENNENFNLVIDDSSLPNTVTLGDYNTTEITIINDDGKNKLLILLQK